MDSSVEVDSSCTKRAIEGGRHRDLVPDLECVDGATTDPDLLPALDRRLVVHGGCAVGRPHVPRPRVTRGGVGLHGDHGRRRPELLGELPPEDHGDEVDGAVLVASDDLGHIRTDDVVERPGLPDPTRTSPPDVEDRRGLTARLMRSHFALGDE